MLLDYLKISFRNMARRKTRTFLTLLGILIAIGSLVALVSLSNGLMYSVEDVFEQMGRDKIMVTPTLAGSVPGEQISSYEHDAIKRVPGVIDAAAMTFKIELAEFSGETAFVYVSGVSTDSSMKVLEDMQIFVVEDGRNLISQDRFRAVVGCGYAQGRVFSREVKVRDTITVGGYKFKVAGILECTGSEQEDTTIMIPLDVSKEVLNVDKYFSVVAQASPAFEIDEVANEIEKRIRDIRGQKEGDEDFSVQTSEQLLETFNQMIGMISVLLVALSLVSIIVAGVVIVNTFYTNVLERRREIGVMKSIGAKNSNIAALFLTEALLISIIGGLLGLGFGFGVSKIVQVVANSYLGSDILVVRLDLYLFSFAMLFSIGLGMFASLYPAIKAAKMHPVDVMRE